MKAGLDNIGNGARLHETVDEAIALPLRPIGCFGACRYEGAFEIAVLVEDERLGKSVFGIGWFAPFNQVAEFIDAECANAGDFDLGTAGAVGELRSARPYPSAANAAQGRSQAEGRLHPATA